jgi:hypothetical protein
MDPRGLLVIPGTLTIGHSILQRDAECADFKFRPEIQQEKSPRQGQCLPFEGSRALAPLSSHKIGLRIRAVYKSISCIFHSKKVSAPLQLSSVMSGAYPVSVA